ncbi:hypothetical protein D9M73_122910 [compost metagenome]
MEGISGAVGGNGVDPRNAQRPLDRRPHLAHAARLPDRHPRFQRPLVVVVGIAQGVGLRLGPAEPGQRIVDNRPVARRIGGALYRRSAIRHRHRDHLSPHRLALAIDQIFGRVSGIELELKHREMLRRRHRVRPGDILVEAKRDDRRAGDPHAHGIILAGQGQVHFIKARRPVPRKMRVSDNEAAPIGGDVFAERPAIAAKTNVARPQRVFTRNQRSLRRAGRHRVDNQWRKRQRARQQHLLLVQSQHVIKRDRANPALAPAVARYTRWTDVAQQLVIPGDIAAHERTRGGIAARHARPERRHIDHRTEEDIRRQIVDLLEAEHRALLRPEPAGSLARDGGELLGQHAQIVLRIGISDAVAEATPGGRPNMRNAEGRAGDRRGVMRRRRGRRHGRRRQQHQSQCRARQIPHRPSSPIF